jgi:alpha-tubulin suppressor-like RCC1 family protein
MKAKLNPSFLQRVLSTAAICFVFTSATALVSPAEAVAPNQALSAGNFFTCGITASGGAQCWGENGAGQLGNGVNQTQSTVPVNVTGLSSGVAALTSGSEHTCALLNTGAVRCWGENGSGSAGDGSTTVRRTPVNVVGLSSGVTAIAAGAEHTCALLNTGSVRCWGSNSRSQLGDGTNSNRLTPVAVSGLSNAIAITAGAFHSCALIANGSVRCWGGNQSGELATGAVSETDQATPVNSLLTGLSAVASRGKAQHSCALTLAGQVQCWGLNFDGQLGTAEPATLATPQTVPGVAAAVAIAVGDGLSCALNVNGGVKCWGNGTNGQLGDGEFFRSQRPATDVVSLTRDVASIVAGFQHTCALLNNGQAKCWGNNTFSNLGNGGFDATAVPVDVQGFAGINLNANEDSDGDGISNGDERELGTNPLLKDNNIFLPNEFGNRLFVLQIYRDFLGRRADAAGLAFWLGELNAGRQTRASMTEAFINGGEFQSLTAPMARLYFGTYLRIPDYAGLRFWTDEFSSGRRSLDNISTAFATVPEFVNRYGNPSNRDFVNLIYINTLGRPGDAAGTNFWTGELDSARLTRGQMLNRFTESPEYKVARFAQVFTTLQYAALLRREPTQSEFDAQIAALGGGATAQARLNLMFSSAEYRNRFVR